MAERYLKIKVTDELHKRLRVKAAEVGKSMQALVTALIEHATSTGGCDCGHLMIRHEAKAGLGVWCKDCRHFCVHAEIKLSQSEAIAKGGGA